MAQRIWVFSPQQGAAAAAGIGVVVHHLIHPLDRQQLRPSAGMARLTAALAATALAPCRRLKARPVTGGRFGGVARAAADLLPQVGQFGSLGGELAAELLDLLLLGLQLSLLVQDEGSDGSWSRLPVRF